MFEGLKHITQHESSSCDDLRFPARFLCELRGNFPVSCFTAGSTETHPITSAQVVSASTLSHPPVPPSQAGAGFMLEASPPALFLSVRVLTVALCFGRERLLLCCSVRDLLLVTLQYIKALAGH